jgi:very-short-patch-repair endonuclease
MKLYYRSDLTEKAQYLRNHPTRAEKVFWLMVKDKQLNYDFHRQKPLGSHIYDFYCYKLRLLIEIDGATHLDDEVKINDKFKDDYAKNIGFRILRFTDDEVLGNGNMVFDRLKEIICEIELHTSKSLCLSQNQESDTPPAPS